MYARCRKPFLVTQWNEELHVRVLCLDFHYGRMIHVIVVVMRDDNSIDSRDVLDLAWNVCVALGAKPGEWTTALAKDRIEEYTESRREFNEIACMAQPRCSKFLRVSRWEKVRVMYRNRRRCRIWLVCETF